jgi:SAM-dependent methyltransferase
MTKSLDLGCGPNPKNLFSADEVYGIDIRDDLGPHIRKADLVIEPIPYEDDSFDFLTAVDFVEHVPRIIYMPHRRQPFIELMNEIYRVLKPGGLFLSHTPAFPQAAAFGDPTHVNIIAEHTWSAYFDDVNQWGKIYGFKGAFKILQNEWKGPHLQTIMQKVYPVPEPAPAPQEAPPTPAS